MDAEFYRVTVIQQRDFQWKNLLWILYSQKIGTRCYIIGTLLQSWLLKCLILFLKSIGSAVNKWNHFFTFGDNFWKIIHIRMKWVVKTEFHLQPNIFLKVFMKPYISTKYTELVHLCQLQQRCFILLVVHSIHSLEEWRIKLRDYALVSKIISHLKSKCYIEFNSNGKLFFNCNVLQGFVSYPKWRGCLPLDFLFQLY